MRATRTSAVGIRCTSSAKALCQKSTFMLNTSMAKMLKKAANAMQMILGVQYTRRLVVSFIPLSVVTSLQPMFVG